MNGNSVYVSVVRQLVTERGTVALEVNDLTEADLANISWAGGSLHSKAVEEALHRVKDGQVEYLAVRAPGGYPVCIGGIDYQKTAGAGTLWQLSTHGELQSLGIGSMLIKAAEDRIRRRGLHTAELGVEDENYRARKLYERLGYVACGHEQDAWDEADEHGNVFTYHAECTVMRKSLR
jgi:ribosomal protein S18 acetylase RimI-like enzyme